MRQLLPQRTAALASPTSVRALVIVPVFMLAFVAMQPVFGSLKISDAARAYARRGPGYTSAEANLEDTLQFDLDVAWPRLQLGIEYAPRLAFVDVLGSMPSPALWLHAGAVQVAWREERYTLALVQSGSLGEQNFSQVGAVPLSSSQATGTTNPAAPGQAGAQAMPATEAMPAGEMGQPLGLLPSARAVRVANEETMADLTVRLTRRLRGELKASFGFSGGADATAQTFLPRQRRAQADGSLGYDWSRSDRLSTLLTGAQIATSNGYDHWLASAIETWSTRWSAGSSAELGVGASFQRTLPPAGSLITRWTPVGSASVMHSAPLRDLTARMQLAVGYLPNVNVLLGTLQNRLQISSVSSLATRDLTVSLTLGLSQTLPRTAPDATTLASMALTLDYDVWEWLSAQTGAQVARQAIGTALSSEQPTWLVYAGVAARAPELRF